MAKNERISRVVLKAMYDYMLEGCVGFKDMCKEDERSGMKIIGSTGQTIIDPSYKMKVYFGPLIGYGYDFREDDDNGIPVKDVYERAVAKTKKMSGGVFETFLAEGIEDDVGWYLTRVDRLTSP